MSKAHGAVRCLHGRLVVLVDSGDLRFKRLLEEARGLGIELGSEERVLREETRDSHLLY